MNTVKSLHLFITRLLAKTRIWGRPKKLTLWVRTVFGPEWPQGIRVF